MRLALVLMLVAGSALAQYRDQQPAVLEPPPMPEQRDPSEEILGAFRAAYRAAGAPRIALFWNVVLTDRLSEATVSSSRVRGENAVTVNRLEQQTSGEAGTSRLVDGDTRRNIDLTVNRSTHTTDSAKRGMPLAERDAWLLESGFTEALLEGGADVIDRNLMMRITAASVDTGKDRDVRAVESKALLGKADVLLEVLMTRDTDSPLGWGFRCTVREIQTGRLMGSFYSKAALEVPKPPARFVTTKRGFERLQEKPVITVDEVGRKLAFDAMGQLKGMLALQR